MPTPVSSAVIAAATHAATTVSTGSAGVEAGRALLGAIDMNLDSEDEEEAVAEGMRLMAAVAPQKQQQQEVVPPVPQPQPVQQAEEEQGPSPGKRVHDATWSPPTEHYLEPTFTSLQQEQDFYTKQLTQHMIDEEEEERRRHHKDLLDPEHAFRRERQESIGTVTSELSEWTVELETKKKIKKAKKGTGTKKIVKKKASK